MGGGGMKRRSSAFFSDLKLEKPNHIQLMSIGEKTLVGLLIVYEVTCSASVCTV